MTVSVPVLKKGSYPHSRGVVQIVDDESIRAVLDQPIPPEGLIFDFDHYSDLTANERKTLANMGIQLPSDASGWIRSFSLAKDGETVLANVDWTEAGSRAVREGKYKYTSPVFPISDCQYLGGNKVRPRRISKVALTNEPNMNAIGAIFANRAPALANNGDASADVEPGVAIPLEANNKPQPKQEKSNMEKINSALGIAKDATEDAAVAAIEQLKTAKAASDKNADALKNRAEKAENEAKELRDAKAKAELGANITAELAKYPNLPNREAAETLLRANFDAGKAFLATLPNTPAKSTPSANAGKAPNEALGNRTNETPDERLKRVLSTDWDDKSI